MFFARGDHLHLRDLCLFAQFPEADQPPRLLRFVGKHTFQCRDANVSIAYSAGIAFASMSIPSISGPDVRHSESPRYWCLLMEFRFVPADALWNLAMAISMRPLLQCKAFRANEKTQMCILPSSGNTTPSNSKRWNGDTMSCATAVPS